MDFIIGTMTGSIAALIVSTIVYQISINDLYHKYAEIIMTLRRINNEYNRQ